MSEVKTFRFGKKFAWGDTVMLAVGECEVDRGCITGNSLEMLTFDQCADHLRHQVCEALDADVTFLDSIEGREDEDEDED